MRQYSDYVYKNLDDSIRVNLFKTETNEWDYRYIDKATRNLTSYSYEAGDYFKTKQAALADAERRFGKLKIIITADKWIWEDVNLSRCRRR